MKKLAIFILMTLVCIMVYSGIGNAAIGDIVFSSYLPWNAVGLVWVDGYLYNVDHGHDVPATLRKINPNTGAIIQTRRLPINHVMGLTWDGSSFWAVSHNGAYIYQLNPITFSILKSFRAPGPNLYESSPKGLAYDGRFLWLSDYDYSADTWALFQIDPQSGAVVKSFPFPFQLEGVTWDGCYLWVSGIYNIIYKVDPNDGKVLSAITVYGLYFAEGDLAFDGTYVWMSRNFGQRLYKIDIGYKPNNLPSANAGADQTVELQTCIGATITLDGTGSYNPEGEASDYIWTWHGGTAFGQTPTVTLPKGVTTVTLSVSDGRCAVSTDTVDITITDTTPPELQVTANPNILWPPSHKLVEITPYVLVTDACEDEVKVDLLYVSQNEPDNGAGDGNTSPDTVIENGVIKLRAERAGPGKGRVYTLMFRATDGSGNITDSSAIVTVPHDMR